MKIGSQDKAWINSELKKIHRLKSREYTKRGKTAKYWELAKEFERKYKLEATKFMNKNVESLKDSNPGKAYRTLKQMGATPGDCMDSTSFSSHLKDNLTTEQSAERIAEHFDEISNSFPPLSVSLLPNHVQTKLVTDTRQPPVVSVYDTWQKIEAAKKPRSGVPGDLPRELNKEFSVELATPPRGIIIKISGTAITSIGKI